MEKQAPRKHSLVEISVTGGEYSMNGRDFTASPGQAKSGDLITIRMTPKRRFLWWHRLILKITNYVKSLKK